MGHKKKGRANNSKKKKRPNQHNQTADHTPDIPAVGGDCNDTSNVAASVVVSDALSNLSLNEASSVSDVLKGLPPRPECPICFLTLPFLEEDTLFMSCCGKVICYGCEYANAFAEQDTGRGGTKRCCAFCRKPMALDDKEKLSRIQRGVAKNDAESIYNLACFYKSGARLVRRDERRAFELHRRAAEMGHPEAAFQLSKFYYEGRVVERDERKEIEYLDLAARRGVVGARFNLGGKGIERGDYKEAMFHWRISAAAGDPSSLQNVKNGYQDGLVSKVDFADTLRAFQAAQDEMRSDARDSSKRYREQMF